MAICDVNSRLLGVPDDLWMIKLLGWNPGANFLYSPTHMYQGENLSLYNGEIASVGKIDPFAL